MRLYMQNPGWQAGASRYLRHVHHVAGTTYSTALAGANTLMPVLPALVDGARVVEALIFGGRP